MKFTSTRNKDLRVSFSQAVNDCIPSDGGVFVPADIEDLRRWLYYIDENTSFTSIAGTLTSALIKDEFSPIICETIATSAFPFEPKISQLDDKLFFMELYNGFTGHHRDYGVSYLCSYLEATNQLAGKKTILLDYTSGELGALLAKVLKGKKNIKAVLVYKKGTVRGLCDEDYVWNGGNILPVEMDGSEAYIKNCISEVFTDKEYVHSKNITVANMTNVCRLLAQIFFFPYSFAQIKSKLDGDIYYAVDSGNYGSLIAGLYSWRLALPVSGFFVPSTAALCVNPAGEPVMLNSMVNMDEREESTPINPANLERLESFFEQNKLMMRNFVYPVNVSEKQREIAAKELYMKYGIYADKETARSYATIKERGDDVFSDEGSIVLMGLKHPSLSADYCRHVLGEAPQMPENIAESLKPVELDRPVIENSMQLKEILSGKLFS